MIAITHLGAAFVRALLATVLLAGVIVGIVIARDPSTVEALAPCGTTITSDLVLSADLDCGAVFGIPAIAVGADGITIDGQGLYSIIAPNASSIISLSGRSGVSIRDINLSGNPNQSILVIGGSANSIDNVTTSWTGDDQSGRGIYFVNSSNNTTTNVTATNRTRGIRIDGTSSGNLFQNNTVTGNFEGILALLSTGQGNLFFDNDLSDNSPSWALNINNDSLLQQASVSGNDFSNSGGGLNIAGTDGISITASIGLTNNFSGTGIGLGLASLDGATVSDLTLGSVANTYLSLTAVSHSTVSDFTVTGSAHNGIFVNGGSANSIDNVTTSWTGADKLGRGVYFVNSSNNTTTNVTASNRTRGIRIDGISPGNSIQCGTFTNNFEGILLLAPLSVTTTRVNLNRIEGNSSLGVRNDLEGTLNAEDNYWGAADGPQGPGLTGSGDFVSINVDAVPFISDPADLDAPCSDNSPPTADAGPDRTVGWTGEDLELDGGESSDANDDVLSFDWSQTAGPAATIAGPADAVTTFSPSVPGVYTFTLTVTDPSGESDSDEVVVNVEDNVAPVIDELSANPDTLWPPNHKMRSVIVTVDVSDACDANPTCQIVSVSSNEPIDGQGDGNTSPDWTITGDLTVDLRAERSGGGAGRVYTITIKCTDSSGNFSTTTVTVSVPHDQS